MPADRYDRTLRVKYGITPEEYAAILEAQGGVCALCLKPPNPRGRTRRLAVDHDHGLAKRAGPRASIRGLICSYPCNYVLVRSRFTAEVLARAAAYLADPPAQRVLHSSNSTK